MWIYLYLILKTIRKEIASDQYNCPLVIVKWFQQLHGHEGKLKAIEVLLLQVKWKKCIMIEVDFNDQTIY